MFGQRPHRLSVMGEERRLAQYLLVPWPSRPEVTHAEAREEVERHWRESRRAAATCQAQVERRRSHSPPAGAGAGESFGDDPVVTIRLAYGAGVRSDSPQEHSRKRLGRRELWAGSGRAVATGCDAGQHHGQSMHTGPWLASRPEST
jgi:hypothetical protein